MIDLHCHSHFSDGELSPSALLNKAIDARIKILALTDHDTTDGLMSLHQAAHEHDIKIINGIELSVRWKKYDIHIIGLNIKPDEQGLCRLIAQQNENRIARARQIAERLLECGIEDAYQKASEIAGHGRVGRPHFAQVLINEGRVVDMKTAFKRFLGQGRAAYVQTAWISIEDAVDGIVQAGGQAVIAHPLKYALTRSKLHELIIAFKAAGGVGMEVISGAMTVVEVNELAGLCTRFELLASTGSDYHGDTLSRTALGRQRDLPVNCTPIWNQWTI
jgi:predicted metal-dependent phosphoesterase TrpH